MNDHPIILFDGICNLCNGAVNFTIKRDKNKSIRFGALQSEQGQQLLRQYQFPSTNFTSLLFIEAGKVYTQSTAALKVCKYLTGLWPLLYGFIIVPKFIRDGLYDWIASNRYKWFGKKEECMIPSPDLKQRFL